MSPAERDLVADAISRCVAGEVLEDAFADRLGAAGEDGSGVLRALTARALSCARPKAALPWLVRCLGGADRRCASEALGSIRELLPWANVRPYAPPAGLESPLETAIATAYRQTPLEATPRLLDSLAQLQGAIGEIALALDRLGAEPSRQFRQAVESVSLRHYPPQVTIAITYRCNAACRYCYAAAQRDASPASMAPERFDGILRRAAQLGFQRVGFTGGEPTLHPDFIRFLQRAREHGMTTFFASNCMFSHGVAEALSSSLVDGVTAHIWFAPQSRDARAKVFLENVRRMRGAGVPVMLRYNLSPCDAVPLDDLERIYHQSGARQINLAVTVPAAGGAGRHADWEALTDESRRLLDAGRAMRKRGMAIAFAKPLPPCVVRKGDWRWLGAIPHSMGTCAIWQVGGAHNVVVNPDGTVWPCIVLNRPLCRFDDLRSRQELVELCAQSLTPVRAPSVQCADCAFWLSRRCQGGCLAFSQSGR
jgi:radical SAM protein with 4Fe4S-binding SPASM domain